MRKKTSFIRRNKFLIIFFILFSIYISYTIYNQNIKYNSLKEEEAFYQNKMKDLHKQIEEVNEEIEKSKSLEAIEKLAREKLNMVKPNEIIYIIQDEEKNK